MPNSAPSFKLVVKLKTSRQIQSGGRFQSGIPKRPKIQLFVDKSTAQPTIAITANAMYRLGGMGVRDVSGNADSAGLA
jgi:hypothetical protein